MEAYGAALLLSLLVGSPSELRSAPLLVLLVEVLPLELGGGSALVSVWGSSLGPFRISSAVAKIGVLYSCVENISARRRRGLACSTYSGGTGPDGSGCLRALVRSLAESIAQSKEDRANMVNWVENHSRVSDLCFLNVSKIHTQ